MIAIIDYDAGNLSSVENALRRMNEPCIATRDKAEILAADTPGRRRFWRGGREAFGLWAYTCD